MKRLNKIKKNLQTIANLQSLQALVNHFSSNFNKFRIFFWFFTETLNLSFHVSHWAGDNTDVPSDSNIWKLVGVNIAFFKEYSISFLIVCRLIYFAIVVLKLLMFKVLASQLVASQKLSFSIFTVLKGLTVYKNEYF